MRIPHFSYVHVLAYAINTLPCATRILQKLIAHMRMIETPHMIALETISE